MTLLISSSVSAQPLKYNVNASGSWYPYATQSAKHPGIVREYIAAVMSEAEIASQHVSLPPKRTVQSIQAKQLDFEVISPSWLSQAQRHDEKFVFSAPLFPVDEYLVALTSKIHQYQTRDSIFRQTVGTVRGYYYHDDNRFARMDFNSERELILALHRGRIDVAIVGDLPAKYWAHRLGVDIVLGARPSSGQMHIRLLREHQPLLPRVNQAIEELKSQGFYEKLKQRYIALYL